MGRRTLRLAFPRLSEPRTLAAIGDFASDGHGIALRRVAIDLVPEEREHLRKLLQHLKRNGAKVKTIVTPIMKRGVEPELGTLGFSTIVPTNSGITAVPRYAVVRPGRPPTGVALPPGQYRGNCPNPMIANPVSPASLDRSTRAIHASYRESGASVVRVVFTEAGARPTDHEVLQRWLSGPLKGWGPQLVTSGGLRPKLLAFLRQGTPELVDQSRTTGGKIVPVAHIQQAAAELIDARRVQPSYAEGRLNSSEAFVGFLKLLTDDLVADGVQLAMLSGPATAAESALTGPSVIQRDDLVASAKQLLRNLPATIPSAFRVGSTLLTADEYLATLALAVTTSSATVEARPTLANDPSAPDLGWGEATLGD